MASLFVCKRLAHRGYADGITSWEWWKCILSVLGQSSWRARGQIWPAKRSDLALKQFLTLKKIYLIATYLLMLLLLLTFIAA